MQKFSLPTLILASLLFLFSCEKEIRFKGDAQQPLMVLNGFLTPDSVVEVHLSKSRFILDNQHSFDVIKDATVELYVNGSFKETLLHKGDGFNNEGISNEGYYRGIYKPLEQDVITIHASAPDMQPIKAETVIPLAPVLELADSTLTYKWEDLSNHPSSSPAETYKILVQTNNIKLLLKDRPEESNGYFLKVDNTVYHDGDGDAYVYPSDVDVKTILKGNALDDTSDFLEDFLRDDTDNLYRKNLFSDTFFKDRNLFLEFQNISFVEIKKYRYGIEVEYPDQRMENQYTIALSAMSEEYYRFVITSQRARQLRDDPFSDPVQVMSNVENGAGILGSYTTSKFVYRYKINYPYY